MNSATKVMIGGAVLALAGCGAAVAPHHHAPPAQPVAVATQPAPSPAQQALAWLAGGGQGHLNAVQGILTRLGTDAGSGNLVATEADGAALQAAATSAEADPIPAAADPGSYYQAAMLSYVAAGADLSRGALPAATREIQVGGAYTAKATAEIQAIGG